MSLAGYSPWGHKESYTTEVTEHVKTERFFGIALLWDWNESTFSSPVVTVGFFKFADIFSAAP